MKLYKTIIIALVMAGILSIAQHHHEDFDEHDDCPVCMLVQNGLDVSDNVPDVAVFLVVIFELVSEFRVFKTNPHFHFSRPRAPPVLSI